MKFSLELPINRPRAEVWKAFDNPENMKIWQPSLISFETIRGTQGQPGAVSKLTYKESEREFSLMERVTYREEPHRLDGVYENNFADNRSGIHLSSRTKTTPSGGWKQNSNSRHCSCASSDPS
jgi:uncharacterized protein YndB with AHSA1/START domain